MGSRIENEFVPYQQALELKELGFDKPCLAYHKDNELYQEAGVCYVNSDFEPTMVWDEMLPNKNCTAPLYQQAFRWFREKYKLEPEIVSDMFGYVGSIVDRNKPIKIRLSPINLFQTYEEAELACLNKLIEIVKP